MFIRHLHTNRSMSIEVLSFPVTFLDFIYFSNDLLAVDKTGKKEKIHDY